MHEESPERVTAAIVRFCRFVRAHGFNVGVQETLDSLEAARTVTVTDKEAIHLALRALLCSSKEECDFFDRFFDVFWEGSRQQGSASSWNESSTANEDGAQGNAWVVAGEREDGPAADGGQGTSGASVQERLRKIDFSQVSQADLPLLEQLALRLWRQMSRRVARRAKSVQISDQLDLRWTIRRSVGRGGEPIDLCYRGKRRKKPRLVVLLDVSGSMDAYSFFLLRFIYALQKHFQRVEAFIFSTRLTPISETLRAGRLSEALATLSQTEAGWSGGTRIGASLRDFNLAYARRILSRNCLFLLMSDGLDTGEPEVLAAELGKIKSRVKRLIWLNPLSGYEHYQPLARGMRAALPYIDVFASAHNLESLLELERHVRVW